MGFSDSIAVSNRHTALQRADQIIVMRDGEVVETVGLEELLDSCDELRQISGRAECPAQSM